MEENMSRLSGLLTMTDKRIQDWLRKASAVDDMSILPMALSGVDDEVKDCVLRNMSVHGKNAVNGFIQEQKKIGINKSEVQRCITVLENLL